MDPAPRGKTLFSLQKRHHKESALVVDSNFLVECAWGVVNIFGDHGFALDSLQTKVERSQHTRTHTACFVMRARSLLWKERGKHQLVDLQNGAQRNGVEDSGTSSVGRESGDSSNFNIPQNMKSHNYFAGHTGIRKP